MKNFFKEFSALSLPLLGLVGTFVFAMFQGGFVSWFLFHSFLPFILVPILLRFSSFKRLTVNRRVKHKEYLFGERIEVEITVKREGFMPLLYIMIEDQAPERLKVQLDNQHKCIRFPFWRKEITYSYCIPALCSIPWYGSGRSNRTGTGIICRTVTGYYKGEPVFRGCRIQRTVRDQKDDRKILRRESGGGCPAVT